MIVKSVLKKALLISCAALLSLSVTAFAQTGDKPEDWATFNRSYSGDRFSPLTQITPSNVAGLKLVASFDLKTDVNSFQTGPLVIDGKMYFSTDTATYAINAADGKLIWKAHRSTTKTSGWGANRGLAYLDGKIFRGTTDGHVLAYNAKNGSLLWNVVPEGVDEPGKFFSMSPVAYDGVLYIGNAGGDYAGVLGSIYALDTKDGHMIWRFVSAPDYKENPKTSTGLQLAGGGFWTSFSLDTQNGVLYAAVGNPAPDFDIEFRGEDRKYFDDVVALDIHSGKVLGYNQIVKNDWHDWDASTAPVLISTKDGRQLVASSNKNGLLTILDRTKISSGENAGETLPFVYEVPTTTRINTDVRLSREHFVYFKPGYLGGNEWNGPAYDSSRGILFNGADDWGVKLKLPPLDSAKAHIPAAGQPWFGFAEQVWDKPEEATGWVKAFDVQDGSVKWQYHATTPIVSGVTPTASGLLFVASQKGEVYAFDSETGKILWQGSTDLVNGGGLITYAVKGKQYVAVVAGMRSSLWPTMAKKSKIMIYSL